MDTRTLATWLMVGWTLGAASARAQEAEVEPDTVYQAHPWYDGWRENSSAALQQVPGEVRRGLQGAGSQAQGVLTEGVRADGQVLLPGATEATRHAGVNLRRSGTHHRDAVLGLPGHVVEGGSAFRDAALATGQDATRHAAHTAAVFHQQKSQAARDKADSDRMVQALQEETNRDAQQALADGSNGVISAFNGTNATLAAAVDGVPQQSGHALAQVPGDARFVLVQDLRGAWHLVRWAGTETPGNLRHTGTDALAAGKHAAFDVRRAADGAKEHTALAMETRDDLSAALESLHTEAARGVDTASTESHRALSAFFAERKDAAQSHTWARVTPEVQHTMGSARRDAADLWRQGYQESFRGGLELAGDNYFAGDALGGVLGTWYAVAGTGEGAATVLVLEPLAFSAHVVTAAFQATFLTMSGAALLAALTGGHGLALAAWGMRTLGDHALVEVGFGALRAGLAGMAGLGIAGVSALGVVDTVAHAGLAPLWVTHAVLAGTARTLGTLAVGAVGAVGVATVGLTGAQALQLAIHLGDASTPWLRAAATSVPAMAEGTARLTGSVVTASARVAWLAGRMAVVRGSLPVLGLASLVMRSTHVAGTAVVDQLVLTPASAVGHGLEATGSAAWALVRDPVSGVLYLAAGTGGFLAGVSAATAVAGVSGASLALLALGKGAVLGTHHGGTWALATAAESAEDVVAPFRFDRQSNWSAERRPQVEEMLARQPEDVRAVTGEEVRYLRVKLSGPDRGKVHFFTTADKRRFYREVQADCAVAYRSQDQVLESGQYDGRCLSRAAQQEGNTP